MMKRLFQIGSLGAAAFLPVTALAVTNVTSSNLEDIARILGPLITRITQTLVAFALLGFFWGLTMYIWNIGKTSTDSHGTASPKVEGKQVMLWGVIALTVLLSITGIIGALQSTFGLSDNPAITPPSASFDKYHYHVGF